MPLRIVIDTNVMVSSIRNPMGSPGDVVRLFAYGSIEVVISEKVRAEYNNVLNRKRFNRYPDFQSRVREIVSLLDTVESIVPAPGTRVVAADPADDKFIAAAIGGAADYIVSGDRHLLDIGSYASIPIVSPTDFLAIVDKSS